MSTGAAIACDSCGSQRDAGFGPCGSCGAVRGEDNRCAACQALAGVRQVSAQRYVCLACGAPRRLRPDTHVSLNHAAELASRARMARLTARIMYGMAGLVGVATLVIGGALAFVTPAVGVGVLVLGGGVALGGALFARSRQTAALRDGAAEAHQRVLAAVRSAGAGVTVEAATRAAGQDKASVDAILTELAKTGRVDMDIDDEGTIRYRIADADIEPDASDDELLRDAEREIMD